MIVVSDCAALVVVRFLVHVLSISAHAPLIPPNTGFTYPWFYLSETSVDNQWVPTPVLITIRYHTLDL